MMFNITDIFQYNFVLQQLYERGYLHKIPLVSVCVNINIKKIFFFHTLQFIFETYVKQNIIFHERLDILL